MTKLRIGTRGSKLALAQAHMVIGALGKACPDIACEVVVIESTGDKTQAMNLDLHKLGGKGLFADTLRQRLTAGDVDLLVHSMKDVPSLQPAEFTIAAMLERGDVRDCFLCNIPGVTRIEDLPRGARVGTSAPRRAALVKRLRPDLQTVTFRGNVPKRIEKLNEKFEDVSATFLARIGLQRLGLLDVPQIPLEVDEFLPAAGQAAIGIEVLSENKPLIETLQSINHLSTFRCVSAERACLAVVDGNCQTSIGAYATETDGILILKSDIYTLDGTGVTSTEVRGDAADFTALGTQAGDDLLARIPVAARGAYNVLA